MTPPLVMPSDLTTLALKLEAEFPGRLGCLFGPVCFKNPRGLPFAIDNGRFPVWSKGQEWDEAKFLKHLDKAAKIDYPPRWVVVPDVVAEAEETFRWWNEWVPRLEPLGWPLALAVQDGMTPESVRTNVGSPEVIFVGGSTTFKWHTLRAWTAAFPRVHVGRVNSARQLWMAHKAGAESTDGTGWWRYGDQKKNRLREYLRRSTLPPKKKAASLGLFGIDQR